MLSKMSVIVFIATYGLPKSCLCAKRSDESSRRFSATLNFRLLKTATQTREREKRSRMRRKIGPPTSVFFWLFYFDTQSSLKLTTVYAVSEDSHRGGPVLLERLTDRTKHTPTHTHTRTYTGETGRRIKGEMVNGDVYMHADG